MAYSPDGRTLAAGYDGGTIRLWDPLTGNLLGKPIRSDGPGVPCLAFHPGGKVLATASDRSVQFWDPATGRLLHREAYPGRVRALAYSPDGSVLAVGDYAGTGWLWPVDPGPAPGRDRRPFSHTLTVTAMAFDPRPGGRTLATASRDGTVRLWDVPGGRPRGKLLFHADEVAAVAWSPDGGLLLTGSKDQTAQLWDADTLAPVGAPWRLDAHVVAVRFAPSSRACVLSTNDGNIYFWHLSRERTSQLAVSHGLPVEQVAFWPDGRTMLTAGWGGVGLSAEDGQPAVLKTRTRLRQAAWARRADVLVSTHWYQDVERWRLHRRGEGQFRVERLLPPVRSGTNRPVVQVALSPDGATVYGVVSANPNQIHRWDLLSGHQPPGPSIRYEGPVSRLVLSPDGKLLGAIVQCRGRPGVWLRPAGDPGVAGHGLFNDERPRCLEFSADGGRIAVGCRSGRVCLWDAGTREQVPWGDGQEQHRGEVLGVAFSPDGQTLLTGGADGRGRFWDIATGLPLGPPLPHTAPVLSVAFRADGQAVLTGCQDRHAYRWRAPLAPVRGSAQEVQARLRR
jgi:WD40 repeat protein